MNYNATGRLTDDAFFARFGKVRAVSIQGPFILSAILKNRTHVFYDWQLGDYITH